MNGKGKADSATVEQIAKTCGVSAVTVSRALRADAPVAAGTRRLILQAAEAAGYQPRVRMGRPRRAARVERPCIEVILGARLHSEFYSVLLTAIERELSVRSHDCVIRTATGGFGEFVRLCEVLRDSPGIPTMAVGYLPLQQLRTLLEVRPQTLLVDHTGDPRLTMPYSSIGFDNTEAARMMVRHLLERGRRRILLLKGFAEHYFSREVEQGYREAMAQAGLPADPELIRETDYTAENAVDTLNAALDAGTKFDAVFTNDEIAAAVLHTLRKCGLRVPEDVAVGGCDGLPFGQYTMPPLTTVLLDHVRLGRMAVEHILEPERGTSAPRRLRLLPLLEVRESTGTI